LHSYPSPYALGPDEGEALWFTEQLITIKAAAEQNGNRFSLFEQFAPGGSATPFHVHPEDDESFYVLDGSLTFYLEDGSSIPASAGSFVHVPGGIGHAFRVASETARMLILTTPQHESFIRAAANPAQARTLPPHAPLDMEKIAAAAREYGVEILGPPPGACAEGG
jgi:quercetin dioxygenase-like cupin family protein